jgi:hypothetical protein
MSMISGKTDSPQWEAELLSSDPKKPALCFAMTPLSSFSRPNTAWTNVQVAGAGAQS